MERTLVIIKPDGAKRKLVGKIIQMIEEKGYTIEEIKMEKISNHQLSIHYGEHINKPFFPDLLDYMSSGKCIIMIVSGENSIQGIRKLMGSTDPLEAEPGSIRGRYANNKTQNLIHGSDSKESASNEIKIFFNGIEK
jgi:nucleoside-diphosphate kinase